MSADPHAIARRTLAGLGDVLVPGLEEEGRRAIRETARAAAALLVGRSRADLLALAMGMEDPREAAPALLAAALAGIRSNDAPDAAAAFLGVASGAVGSVPQVALAEPGAGTVRHLLSGSSPSDDASRDQRIGELFIAGTLVRAGSRTVSIQDGLDAVALVAATAREADAIDVEALLRHAFAGVVDDATLDEPGLLAALAGGALTLAAVPRVTGGLLTRDAALERKGWTRAAALLAELARHAGLPKLCAADAQAAASRMASDPQLLGDPATTVTDVLTMALGLQAAAALGGVADAEPVTQLLGRLVAHASLAGR